MAGQVVDCGNFSVFSGGTRKAVKTFRPWQVPMRFGNCPFCKNKQENEMLSADGQRRCFDNAFTPNAYHQLIIPTHCTDSETELRNIDAKTLTDDWRAVLDRVLATCPEGHRLSIESHSYRGYSAGQNQPHIHYHALAPTVLGGNIPVFSDVLSTDFHRYVREDWILNKSESFVTAAFGPRTGQMVVYPRTVEIELTEFRNLFTPKSSLLNELAGEVANLVSLFNEKFLDNNPGGSGLSPDFMLILSLISSTNWFASYVPILNNQGGTEILAMMQGKKRPFVLAWPHEVTIEYLRGN